MKRARFTEEQIIGVLREHKAGAKTADLARKHGVSEATLYNWKAKFGGMDVSEAKRLRQLEDEKPKLKKPLAEQMLDDAAALRELLSKKWYARPSRISGLNWAGTAALLDRQCRPQDDPLPVVSVAGYRTACPTARTCQRPPTLRLSPAVRTAASAWRAVRAKPNLPDAADFYAAQINWGDGTTSSGTVVGSNGNFTVEAGHDYADEANMPLSVAVTNTADSVKITLNGAVAVAEGDHLTGIGHTLDTNYQHWTIRRRHSKEEED
jgi:putative transposase